MADRDKIPNSVRYQQTYKEICENQNGDTVAKAAVQRIARRIRRSGHGGLTLIRECSSQLNLLTEDSLLRHIVVWDDEHDLIDRRADFVEGDPDLIDSARRACHELLDRLEDGQPVDSLQHELRIQMYMNEWYAFEESIPEHASHHQDALYEEIIDRIEYLSPIVIREIRNHLTGQKLPEVNAFDGDMTKGLIV